MVAAYGRAYLAMFRSSGSAARKGVREPQFRDV